MEIIFWSLIATSFAIGLKKPIDIPDLPPVPNKCHMTNAMYKQCCIFPPFFTRDVARECGAKLTVSEMLDNVDIVTIKRQMFNKCEFWECVLKTYDLITYDDLLNDEKYFSHLDRWVDLNSNFAEVIKKAKVHCKLFYKTYMPLKKCEFFTFQSCIRNYVNLNCPVIVPTPECENQKKFYEECKEYFYK